MKVEVYSDVMCPWCYIGKRRLEKAAASHPDLALDVRWRPFQLDANIPEDGMDRRLYLERKFGSSENVERIYAPVRAAGEAEQIAALRLAMGEEPVPDPFAGFTEPA